MSFAVAAIYKRCEVYIAADTQTTGMFSGKTENGISKITEISKSAYISSCGNVDFCRKCLEFLKEKRTTVSYYSRNCIWYSKGFALLRRED